MSKCYEFPSFGIYIFLVEVKHQYVVENVYFSDDISLGLVLALFYLKSHCTDHCPSKVRLVCNVLYTYIKKVVLKANSTFYKNIISKTAALNACRYAEHKLFPL